MRNSENDMNVGWPIVVSPYLEQTNLYHKLKEASPDPELLQTPIAVLK